MRSLTDRGSVNRRSPDGLPLFRPGLTRSAGLPATLGHPPEKSPTPTRVRHNPTHSKFVKILYHLIFATRNREPALRPSA